MISWWISQDSVLSQLQKGVNKIFPIPPDVVSQSDYIRIGLIKLIIPITHYLINYTHYTKMSVQLWCQVTLISQNYKVITKHHLPMWQWSYFFLFFAVFRCIRLRRPTTYCMLLLTCVYYKLQFLHSERCTLQCMSRRHWLVLGYSHVQEL